MLQENRNMNTLMPVSAQQGDPLSLNIPPSLHIQGPQARPLPIHHWSNSLPVAPQIQYQERPFIPGINHLGWVPQVQPRLYLCLLFLGHHFS